MAETRRDVNLVIRAKDEASRAFEQATAVLEQLVGINKAVGSSATAAGADLAKYAEAAVTLDRVFGTVSGAADRAAASFERQQATLAGQRAELAALQTQAKNAATAMERLNSADAIVDAGRNQGERLAQLQAVTQEVARLEQAQDKLRNSIAVGEAQLEAQRSTLQQIGSTTIAAAEAREKLTTEIRQQTTAIREQAEANSALHAIEQNTGVNHQKKFAEESANVFKDAGLTQTEREFEAAAEAEAAAIANLRNEINPLAAAEAHLSTETQKLNGWFKAGKITTTEHSAAVKLLNADFGKLKNSMTGIDSRGRPSLFGLKPYEVQNLGFQINDIVTQLASGTSLSQTLAQQSGQLIQIFPRLGSSIIAAFTSGPLLLFIATLGTLILAVHKAQSEAEKLRTLQGILDANADGALHSAAALAEATHQLDRYGLSAEEALDVTKRLLNEGFRDDQIVALGEAAKNLADVLGIKVADAAEKVAQAFGHGFDSIKKLDDATNFLTASQREHIRVLFEHGKAQDAVTEATRLFEERYSHAAEEMRGPWTDALRSLSDAWDSFITFLANNAVIQTVAGSINLLGQAVTGLFDALGGAPSTASAPQSDLPQEASLDDKIKEADARIAALQRILQRDTIGAAGKAALESELKTWKSLADSLHDEQTNASESTKKQTEDLRKQTEELQAQSGALSEKARLQKAYNDALLDAQEKFPFASAEEQAAFAAQKRLVVEKQIAEEHKRQTAELERQRKERERELNDPVLQSVNLLKQLESFQSKAKFDVNAFRAGFGSDTATRSDGRIERVVQSTVVSMDDAVRDLQRRVVEFQNVIKQQIGSERFAEFSAKQQAALTSIAYNYGRLPDRIVAAVKSGTNAQIAQAVRGLGSDNNGVNAVRRGKEADILGQQNLAVDEGAAQRLADLEADRLKVQTKFDEKLQEENDRRKLDIESMTAQKGLLDDALLAEQRKEFIAQEALKAQQEVDRLNAQRALEGKPAIVITEQQTDAIKKQAAAYFDLAHAREVAANQRKAVEQPVQDLSSQRDAIQQQIDFLRQNGDAGLADKLLPQLDQVNSKLGEAIQKVIAFWTAVMNGANGGAAAFGLTNTQIQAMITGLNTAGLSTARLSTFMGITATSIANAFTGDAVNAIDHFAQAVADGKNVFKSMKEAFLEFASSFLIQIAKMILQQIIFNAVMQGLKAIGIGVPVAHSGGVIGSSALQRRTVSPGWFSNAMRYHVGGIAGLRPGEVPAILKQGEEVLRGDDPRHVLNGGKAGSGGAPPNIKIVNAIDAGDFVSQGLGTRTGERAILNFIRVNAGAVRQAMNNA